MEINNEIASWPPQPDQRPDPGSTTAALPHLQQGAAVPQSVSQHAAAQEPAWDQVSGDPGRLQAALEVVRGRALAAPTHDGTGRHRRLVVLAARRALRVGLALSCTTVMLFGLGVAGWEQELVARGQLAPPQAALVLPPAPAAEDLAPVLVPAAAPSPPATAAAPTKARRTAKARPPVVRVTPRLAEPEPMEVQVRLMAAPGCKIDNARGDVKPNVRQVACFLANRFGVTVLGRQSRGTAGSDHPTGLAADFLVGTRRSLGQNIANCASGHFNDWGIKYVIWRQAIKVSAKAGFRGMEDRGGVTANHFDHVHISFNSGVSPRNLAC